MSALEIADGLEQWDDVDHEPARAREADLLEQERNFEQIGERLAFRDDVVGQRGRPETMVDIRGGAQDRELGGEELRARKVRAVEQPRVGEVGDQQRHALALRQRGVVAVHPRARQELGDDGLVHVGVLAQVERCEMKPEDVDGAPQRLEPSIGQRL